jgi:hypothetical protein
MALRFVNCRPIAPKKMRLLRAASWRSLKSRGLSSLKGHRENSLLTTNLLDCANLYRFKSKLFDKRSVLVVKEQQNASLGRLHSTQLDWLLKRGRRLASPAS